MVTFGVEGIRVGLAVLGGVVSVVPGWVAEAGIGVEGSGTLHPLLISTDTNIMTNLFIIIYHLHRSTQHPPLRPGHHPDCLKAQPRVLSQH